MHGCANVPKEGKTIKDDRRYGHAGTMLFTINVLILERPERDEEKISMLVSHRSLKRALFWSVKYICKMQEEL